MKQLLLTSENGNEYTFAETERLGNGAFGDVFKGFDRKRLQQVAIKRVHNNVLDRYGEEFIRCLGNEANILQEMGGAEYTVAIIDCFQTSTYVNIIMEFCDGGTLRGVLDKKPGCRFDENEALGYLAEIVEGIYVMHKSGRMHRDLKLENIFFKEGHCKIGDFGFATKQEKSDQYVGTPDYMAPEIFECGEGNYYDKAVDVWALGIMYHEMLFNTRPYEGPQTKLAEIIRSNPYNPPSFPPISEESKDLLKRMLTADAKKRITIQEVRSHPVLKGKIIKKELLLKSSKSDEVERKRVTNYDLNENQKSIMVQSLTDDYVHRIFKKLDNYRKCCYEIIQFFGNIRNFMKSDKGFVLDDLHVLGYYLLKWTYNKFNFLLTHFEKQECPHKLFKPVEADYWQKFVKSNKFGALMAEYQKGLNLTEKIFAQFRSNELPKYLDRAGRNRQELDTIYTNNLDSDCTASFTGKLLEASYLLQKLSQTKKEAIYEEFSKILLDLEFVQLIEEYIDHYEVEIDLESYKHDRENKLRDSNTNIRKYLKVRSW